MIKLYHHASQAEESNEGHYSGTQLYPRLAIGTPGFPPKACSRVSRQRSTAADRVSVQPAMTLATLAST